MAADNGEIVLSVLKQNLARVTVEGKFTIQPYLHSLKTKEIGLAWQTPTRILFDYGNWILIILEWMVGPKWRSGKAYVDQLTIRTITEDDYSYNPN
ncbi:hypothetical protein DAPPUDRAFT_324878 [Daphnia pulex]|uniref:Uncharacterized protein n=1 Tax=Daphnia pulex TaxID=6669 RepID=E9H313_DAPPU|nr:hypothetical protein DAPPUDRAFT_324878 [Daphnia pulex]|eukprot:EFX73916.1 hypothetical protein DAPPUDRAFT_324878 [Daphnia pulex]